MTIEEAKKELKSYRHRKKSLKILEVKIQELERKANGNGSMTISETPGISGGQRLQMKDIVNQILDLKKEYWEKYLENEKLCCEILEKRIYEVGKINALFANILSFYYIHGLSLFEISKEINYSYDRTRYLFIQAVRAYASTNLLVNTFQHI